MSERSLSAPARDASMDAGIQLGEVNPFSLVEAVNSTSEIAHTGWLIFLGVVTYFCIAAAGVSHKDLLLNSAVPLPIMQVSIDLQRFFLFAPIVLVFLHFGLLVQHVMLARKVMEFDAAVRTMEPTHRRTHPIRHELNSYFFTQALAGPERSKLFGGFLHGMFWLSFVGIPALVILFVQIVYLPYHDITTTWSHRLMLVLDAILLALMSVFLSSRATSFFGALGRTLRHQPASVAATTLLYAGAILFSFFVATVPDEPLDRFTQALPWTRVNKSTTADGQPAQRRVFAVTDWFFGLNSTSASRLFRRNLSVTDEVVVDRKTVSKDQATVSLRDRDLRYAELDRSDLQQADFTGADLTGARLVGANLRGARFSCLDVDAVLTDPKLRGESCANLTGANLSRADLTHADLRLALVSGANLENATLTNSDLRFADLTGANLAGADLRGASMGGGVELMGANLLGANLGGADLKGAKLQAADFYGAELQGARLVFAQAQGANFQGAHLQGANLSSARLQGADFTDADLTATDFGAAIIWETRPPSTANAMLADAAAIAVKPIEPKDVSGLTDVAKLVAMPKVAAKLTKLIERLTSADESAAWNAGDEATLWAGLKQAGLRGDATARRDKAAGYLAKLSCAADHSDGAVAAGIIRRVVDAPLKSDPALLLKKLLGADCPAFKKLPEAAMFELEAAVEKTEPILAASVAPAAPEPPAPAQATAAQATGGPASDAPAGNPGTPQ